MQSASNHYVYCITNIFNDMKYIGTRTSTKLNLLEDLKFYKSSSKDKQFMQEQKEKPENFKYEILKTFLDRKSAVRYEIKLHNKYDVCHNKDFYNRAKQTATGFDQTGSTLNVGKNNPYYGKTHSQETLDKMYVSKKRGKDHHRYGKGMPIYIKEKLREANLGRKLSEEHIQKLREARKDRTFSEETKRKISIAHKGIPKSEEHRIKLREANLGKKLSEEHRRKISEGGKGRKPSQYTNDLNAFPIKAYGVLYRSVYDASDFLNISASTVRRFALDINKPDFVRFEKGYIAKHYSGIN